MPGGFAFLGAGRPKAARATILPISFQIDAIFMPVSWHWATNIQKLAFPLLLACLERQVGQQNPTNKLIPLLFASLAG